eukprot:2292794-Pyramimonas_sp.AAC.1
MRRRRRWRRKRRMNTIGLTTRCSKTLRDARWKDGGMHTVRVERKEGSGEVGRRKGTCIGGVGKPRTSTSSSCPSSRAYPSRTAGCRAALRKGCLRPS